MCVELVLQNSPGANTPGKQIFVLVFNLELAVVGLAQLFRPEILPRPLRFRKSSFSRLN
jgi:hypothetical protein